ncbi:phospholipid N-methyltransferase [Kordia periserrulae]|uniref:Phospholipid N-methyltransferase n=1 Tax=Kordia periserrulae TaxID=701523 RepID=A0A2T6C6R9_9FLAO|nr:rRNA adenine N-6-methyltransferase family protein [Kordia periserrulae]PTX63966.1 phospholipid N-methyltransferase [Kordia periserrulae]
MDRLKFFREAIRDIKTSGTIVPSSRFLTKRMVKHIDFDTVKVIVEFGPGNGIITKEILKRIRPGTKLIAFEINNRFFESLEKIKHSQLIIEKVSAEEITPILQKHGFDKVDCVVSSLPFTNIPAEISDRILDNTYEAMRDNSVFVQYQYSLSYYKKLKEVFKDKVKLSFEAFNIPPAFVYIAKK